MKQIGAFTLVFAAGISLATAAAQALETGRGGAPTGSMSEMMRGPASEMMRSMPMGTARQTLGRERPLLSLALRHRAELGLSEDQAKTLEALVDRFGEEAGQRLREIDTAERELAEPLKQEPGDLAQVESKVRAIEKLRADLRLARIRTIAEGRAVLTPEQRTKLDPLAAGQGGPGRGHGTRGAEEMHRFMNSERMPQAMSAMMAMAERMGGGDMMLGMVRMMEMMSMMSGGMMGGGGMMGDPERRDPPRQERE